MGTFGVRVRVWNPADATRVEELDLMVDTGAAFSWISRERLQRLGVASNRRMPFKTIEGKILERELGVVYVGAAGNSVPDLVVMTEAGEIEVLGAHSLEGLGVAADPIQKRLVSTVMLAL